MGWTVGVSSAHFNQHKKCANARFSLFFFFQFAFFVLFGRSSVQAPVCFLEQVLICSLF